MYSLSVAFYKEANTQVYYEAERGEKINGRNDVNHDFFRSVEQSSSF